MSEIHALRFGALLFTTLYAVAVFLPTLPEGAYSDDRVLSLVNEAGSRTNILIGGCALMMAGIVFAWWGCVLGTLIDAPGSSISRVVLATGLGYGLLLMLAATSFSGVALGMAVGELPPAEDAYLVRALSDHGFGLVLVPGLWCAALAITAASVGLRRADAVPRWVAGVGFGVAPLLLLGFAWVPQFLVPLWTLVVGFSLRSGIRRADVAERPATTVS